MLLLISYHTLLTDGEAKTSQRHAWPFETFIVLEKPGRPVSVASCTLGRSSIHARRCNAKAGGCRRKGARGGALS